MNRRTFLGALGAGAAAAACGDNLDGGRFAGFTMAVQSWTFREFSLDEALAMMNSLGLTRIELSPVYRHLQFPEDPAETDATRERIAAAGIDCVTAHIPLPLEGLDEDLYRRAFEHAQRLGVRTIMVDPPLLALDHLEALCVELDLRVAIHNHVLSPQFQYVEQVLAAVEGRDRRVGALVDTGHYTRLDEDAPAAIRALGSRVLGVHLKDVHESGATGRDAILGEGILDLTGVFRALREVRFPADASLSIEYEANPEAPYDDLVVALDNIASAAQASRR